MALRRDGFLGGRPYHLVRDHESTEVKYVCLWCRGEVAVDRDGFERHDCENYRHRPRVRVVRVSTPRTVSPPREPEISHDLHQSPAVAWMEGARAAVLGDDEQDDDALLSLHEEAEALLETPHDFKEE